MAHKKVIHSVSVPQAVPAVAPDSSATAEEKFTVRDAFDYCNVPSNESPDQSPLNSERCILAVGFLLHYLSDGGNSNIDGWTAHGLGYALEKCAADWEQHPSLAKHKP